MPEAGKVPTTPTAALLMVSNACNWEILKKGIAHEDNANNKNHRIEIHAKGIQFGSIIIDILFHRIVIIR